MKRVFGLIGVIAVMGSNLWARWGPNGGDVGITDAIVPTDFVFVNTKYFPTVTVTNFTQNITETFSCVLHIEDKDNNVIYLADVDIDGLAGSEERDIIFDKWIVPPEAGERYTLYATSHLLSDENPDNDSYSWTVRAILSGILDVGVEKIIMPEKIYPGDEITPKATIKNYGTITPSSFDVECKIEPGDYIDIKAITDLGPNDTCEVEFVVWFPFKPGGYIITVTTLLEDDNPANNSKERIIGHGISEESVPKEFVLSLIKPNPFSWNTEIFYQLPFSSEVSLTIYDISGKLIRTLTRAQHHKLGIYTLKWDGRDDEGGLLPSGVYFIRFKTGDYSKTQKVILFR